MFSSLNTGYPKPVAERMKIFDMIHLCQNFFFLKPGKTLEVVKVIILFGCINKFEECQEEVVNTDY